MAEEVEKEEKKEWCPICGGAAIVRSTGDTLRCEDCGVSFFFMRSGGPVSFAIARGRGILNRVMREHEKRAERLRDLIVEISSYATTRTPEEILRDAGVKPGL
jgi:ribosomal protein L37AE/L43A